MHIYIHIYIWYWFVWFHEYLMMETPSLSHLTVESPCLGKSATGPGYYIIITLWWGFQHKHHLWCSMLLVLCLAPCTEYVFWTNYCSLCLNRKTGTKNTEMALHWRTQYHCLQSGGHVSKVEVFSCFITLCGRSCAGHFSHINVILIITLWGGNYILILQMRKLMLKIGEVICHRSWSQSIAKQGLKPGYNHMLYILTRPSLWSLAIPLVPSVLSSSLFLMTHPLITVTD